MQLDEQTLNKYFTFIVIDTGNCSSLVFLLFDYIDRIGFNKILSPNWSISRYRNNFSSIFYFFSQYKKTLVSQLGLMEIMKQFHIYYGYNSTTFISFLSNFIIYSKKEVELVDKTVELMLTKSVTSGRVKQTWFDVGCGSWISPQHSTLMCAPSCGCPQYSVHFTSRNTILLSRYLYENLSSSCLYSFCSNTQGFHLDFLKYYYWLEGIQQKSRTNLHQKWGGRGG